MNTKLVIKMLKHIKKNPSWEGQTITSEYYSMDEIKVTMLWLAKHGLIDGFYYQTPKGIELYYNSISDRGEEFLYNNSFKGKIVNSCRNIVLLVSASLKFLIDTAISLISFKGK